MGRTLLTCVMVWATATTLGLASEEAPMTSDPLAIDAESYRLCTEVQARIWHDAFYPEFIDWPEIALAPEASKTIASLRAAERALRLDERNLYAHALLARYYLVPLDTEDLALESWRLLFDHGHGVSLPARVAKASVLIHVRADGIHLFGYEGLGVRGELPDASERLFWDANAGNIPTSLQPATTISWGDVEALHVDESGWRLALADGSEVSILFRAGVEAFTWDLDWYDFWYSVVDTEGSSQVALDYYRRLRSAVLELVDPEGRIRDR